MTKAALEAAIGHFETLIQVFAVLVAIGIVGEVGFGIRLWILNKRLHATQHAEDLNQEQAIAALNKEAGDARKDAAEAGRQAAEANKIAEQERLARLKIEEKMADRHLTPEQQHSIAGKLRPFTGQSIDLFAYSSDGEILGIAKDIILALNKPSEGAGWKVHPSMGQELSRAVRGILVEVTPDADANSKLAANALVAALQSERVHTTGPQSGHGAAKVSSGNRHPKAQITITIGKKP